MKFISENEKNNEKEMVPLSNMKKVFRDKNSKILNIQ